MGLTELLMRKYTFAQMGVEDHMTEPAGDRGIRDLRGLRYSSRELDRLVSTLKDRSPEAATLIVLAGASRDRMTIAAEAIAKQLELNLLHVALSQVVTKYIGETEKNLHLVFDEASRSGAPLLLDEADALFGKRTEGEPAGDPVDSAEWTCLLQHIDAYTVIVFLIVNDAELAKEAAKRPRRASTVVVLD